MSSGIPATSEVAREFAKDPGPDDIACVPAGSKVTIKHDVKVKGFVNHGDLTIAGGRVDFGNAQNG